MKHDVTLILDTLFFMISWTSIIIIMRLQNANSGIVKSMLKQFAILLHARQAFWGPTRKRGS